MQIPRDATLAEALYRDIDKNDYLQEIYSNLLYNYSIKLFGLDRQLRKIPIHHALRFADLLSKSTYGPTIDRDRLWGQELAILLRFIYPEDTAVKYYLGSVLSSVGNYRGLESAAVDGYNSVDVFDQLYYGYDQDEHKVPGEDFFFFHDQKRVYDNLSNKFFSYSGPTSMGKSFVIQTYIKQQIEQGSTLNYAILVPTKALINEVRSSIINSLQDKLKAHNYRVISAAGDLALKQDHHFIFVMTPERLLHMMIERTNITIDFLFIDEAHKISDRGGRSTYYYKVLTQLNKTNHLPTVIFASPNIPNPEVYLRIIPGINPSEMKKLASKFTPVCQFKYYLDIPSHKGFIFNDYTKEKDFLYNIPATDGLPEIVKTVGASKQNLVYCSSRRTVVDYAVEYAKDITPIDDDRLRTLAQDIRDEVHKECFLADLVLRGVAYHVGYLPANIRLRIERAFEEGALRTIFCTSTLVEGVNLPADNLFITSYKDGRANMDEVEFRNLVGRVGRIKYNLYGNAYLIRLNDTLKEDQFIKLLKSDVPPQELSLEIKKNHQNFATVISDLISGDVTLTKSHEAASEEDFDALRKFALILTRDIATDSMSPVRSAFEPYLNAKKIQRIKEFFPEDKTSDDITLSYDQYDNLQDFIADPKKGHYPFLVGADDQVDFEEVVQFLLSLRTIFRWEEYERETLGKPQYIQNDGKPGGILRWYATILLRWIRGNGLRTIIRYAIDYKEKHPQTGVWLGRVQIDATYDPKNQYHKNYVIAETLSTIENVLLFSISNYFRKFSLEYKAQHNVENFTNDWYEYVEYGTTNPLTIFLQQVGFSRESSIFLQKIKNKRKYIIETDADIKIKKDVLSCGNIGVETEAQDIQFNMPELFVN